MIGGLGALYYLGSNTLFNVEGGHAALVFNKITGVKDFVYPVGTHFRIPYFDRPVIFDIRTRPRLIQSLTGTRDLQMVNLTIRVLSRPDSKQLRHVYLNLGRDYDEVVLPSIGNEVAKGVVAQFDAAQLITKREQVSRAIRDRLVERARDFRIVLDDVSITNLTFGPDYTAAVEAKQVAQQEAERAKYD